MALLRVSRSLCMFAVSAVLLVTPVDAANGDVRLVSGPNPYEGRVEYYDGVWLGLCLPYVDNKVPTVICRQLGYPTAGALMYYGPSYGAAPGEIYRRRISCIGNEASLSACSMADLSVNCDPINTLGVSCNTNITVSQTVRLRGGADPHEGRLEIFYSGIWGTVCRSEGDQYIYRHINARAVCRKLFGIGYVGSYFSTHETPSRFGILQSGAIHRYFVQCKGAEDNLLDCPFSAVGSSCDHEQDVTLRCYPVPEGCGGHLTSNSGIFQSPVYPDDKTLGYDTECVWTIAVTYPYQFVLSITINEVDELAQTSNRLSVIDSNGYSSKTHDSLVLRLASSGSVMYVRLTTAKNSTGIKFTASWGIPCDTNFTSTAQNIQSLGYYSAYPPNLDCTYFIQQRAEYTVKIQFNTFDLDERDNGSCLDYMTVYDGDSESAPILGGPYCGNTKPPVLTSTQNVVVIKFHSDGNTSGTLRRFYISYNGLEPEPIVTQLASDLGTIQSPGYPNMYNNETDYIWNITASKRNQVIILTFTDFLTSNCYYFKLEIRDYVSGINVANLCGLNQPTTVTSAGHVMYVRLVSTPATSGPSGGKFKASWTAVTVNCDKNFTSTAEYIQLPGYSTNTLAYIPDLDCTYFIQQTAEHTIRLTFAGFSLDEQDNGTCLDFLTVYDGDSESDTILGGPYCGKINPPVLTSTQNIVMIKFHSDGNTSSTSRGFNVHYSRLAPEPIVTQLESDFGTIQSPGYPSMYNNETDYIWNITASKRYQVITLTFSDFIINNCYYSKLEILDYVSGITKANLCGSSKPATVTSTGQMMYVKFVSTPTTSGQSGGKFMASWTSEPIVTQLESDFGTIQSPGYPSMYNNETDYVWNITASKRNQVITLTFSDFIINNCYYSKLEIRDYVSGITIANLCGSSKPAAVTSTGHVMYVRLVSTPTTSGQTGGKFMASWTSDTVNCDKNFTSAVGYIQSSGYSAYTGAYIPDLDCTYFIQQSAEFTVRLTFLDFSLDEQDNGTCFDFLTIHDGDSASAPRLGGPYCGNAKPPVLTSTQNVVTIKFHSDGNTSSTSRGFNIYYFRLYPEPRVTQIASDTGTIQSPVYPNLYNNETDYVWNITASKPYKVIILTFSDFLIHNCYNSYLEVYDVVYSSSLVTLCGLGKPTPVTSRGHVMYMRLVSTPTTNGLSGAKYSASWTSECSQRFTDTSGTITSPDYPSQYPTDLNCTRTIIVNHIPGYAIKLNFISFQLDAAVDGLCHDYVEVRDGSFENSNLIGERYCGTSLPPTMSSTQNSILIRFHSDGVTGSNSSGFKANYQLFEKGCEAQVMTESKGNISSPDYPSFFPRNTYCIWTVTVDPRYVIQLTFNAFSVGQRNRGCSYAYVRLYDSYTVDADTVIDTFCGSGGVPKISTRSNSLTVVLNSFYSSTYTTTGFHASYWAIEKEEAEVSISDLLPYGYNQGDLKAKLSGTAMQKVTLNTEFRYGSVKYQDVYIGANGVVSIENPYSWPNLPVDSKVICVYCAYTDDSDSVGGIFYHQYGGEASDAAILKRASRDVLDFSDDSTDFKATVALVVTWDRIKQGQYSAVDFRPENEIGEATFQLVLVSDGLSSYILMYYLTGAMTWTYRGSWSYVILGYSNGKEGDYHLNLYSRTRRAYSLDAIVGNTGRKGLWIYKVGQAPLNPEDVCLQWYSWNLFNQDVSAMKQRFAQLPSCPCSGSDVWRKVRYLWTLYRKDSVNNIQCYQLNQPTSSEVYPYGKECCYSGDKLIMDPPYAGSALAYNPTFPSLRVMNEWERTAHTACCLSGIGAEYCRNRYYDIRPIGECLADIPFRFAWLWGDPHITTLDEREYAFNGLGEYTLVLLTTPKLNFTLQGRMERAQRQNETNFNGTVFTAFGVKENKTSVFVGLHPIKRDALEIYVDGQDYSRRFQQEGEQFLVESDKFTVFTDNGSFVISFRSGITLAVAMGIRSLATSISLPLEFRTKTTGLLGNYNGVKGDDFVLPDGTVLSDSMSDRDIHFKFGQKWAVTAQNTVLRYGLREGPANFSRPEFTPVFLDELSPAVRQAAEAVCGSTETACIYDFVVTGSEDFALDTKRRTLQMRKETAQSKNTLPELSIPVNVSVTLGQPATFSVSARDPDVGDSVTYTVVDTNGGKIAVNPSTGRITANVDIYQPIHVQVYATDSTNGQSVVRSVPIIMCSGCNNHGDCDISRTRESNVTFYFQQAVCVCREGWIGEDCDKDRDACLDNPCDPLQTCTDFSPLQRGSGGVRYSCSDCPAGYSVATNGSYRCLDVDECSNPRLNGCAQGCENTHGSYTCSCTSGYRLSSDARTCLDVNECAEKSDNCQQVCSNTVGGFQCLCQPGYTYDSVRNACDQTAATREVCQNKNCSQGCRAVTNPSTNLSVPQCFCRAGYDLDPVDGVTCRDHDECRDGLCAQVCTNTVGGFGCSCYSGHLLNNDQRTCSPCPSLTYGPGCSLNCSCSGRAVACHAVTGCVCQEGWTGRECRNDLDECARNPDICGQGKVCVNNEGSFACTCPPGYEVNKDENCADVDECTTESQACGDDQRCTNVPGSYFCTCTPGYRLHNGSCGDIDECSVNGGGCQQRCVNTKGSYNCDCYYGYTLNTDRSSCAKVSEPCSGMTSCSHGCTLDDNDMEVCFCHTGYKLQADRRTCLDVNECATGVANCSHTCNNTQGAFICSCPVGMRLGNDGTTCEGCPRGTYGMNCAHICNCSSGSDRCDVITGCVCKTGWAGEACDADVNECMTSAGQEACQRRNAECINLLGGYKCVCRTGFAMDNDSNCQDVNECLLGPPCSQQCENLPGSYRCLCRAGFSLENGTGECKDIDECRLASTHSCTQRCQNVAGSYRCSCLAGYTLANDGHTCTVQRQCTRTDCDSSNGGCIIEGGQEKCFCNIGYVLGSNNVSCSREAVDWCTQGACDQQCQKSADGMTFTCSCTQGHLLNDDKRTCRACPSGTYGANCASNCTCNVHHTQSCNPVTGECNCSIGWQGATCSNDVNECVQMSPPVCPSPKGCLNTAGSYVCFCVAGYVQLPNGTCQECPLGKFGANCSETCTCVMGNTESCDKVNGTCTCKAGRKGTSCDLDIDECQLGTHNCSAASHSTCKNTVGSFTCICDAGYNMNQDGACAECPRGKFGANCSQTCTCVLDNTESCDKVNGTCTCKAGRKGTSCDLDIDECQLGTHNCSAASHSTCKNTVGSFACICDAGYSVNQAGACAECTPGKFGLNCSETCTCRSDNTASCDKVNGTCSCKAGWEGRNCDLDIDECASSANNCSANSLTVCENILGSFACACKSGYGKNKNGVCIAARRLRFFGTVLVNFAGDLTPTSADFQLLKWQAETALFTRLGGVRGLLGIVIISIRRGSLVLEADAVVDNTDASSSAVALTAALVGLNGQNLTVGNLTGPVVANTSSCHVFLQFGMCEAQQKCQLVDGTPACQSENVKDDSTLKLIIGLAVGIPVGVVIVCAVVVACCYMKSGRKKKGITNEQRRKTKITPDQPGELRPDYSPPTGRGKPPRFHSNPYYGDMSKGADNLAFSAMK